MELTEKYTTVKASEFQAMEQKIADLEEIRKSNLITVEVKNEVFIEFISSISSSRHNVAPTTFSVSASRNAEDLSKIILPILTREITTANEANKDFNKKLDAKLQQITVEHTPEKHTQTKITFWQNLKRMMIGAFIGGMIAGASHSCQAQRMYHTLEGTYIGLQAADVVLTYKGIKLGAREANPVAGWMIDNKLLIPGKLIFTSSFLYMCRQIRRENTRLAMVYLIAGNLVYGAVVANNYRIVLTLKI